MQASSPFPNFIILLRHITSGKTRHAVKTNKIIVRNIQNAKWTQKFLEALNVMNARLKGMSLTCRQSNRDCQKGIAQGS